VINVIAWLLFIFLAGYVYLVVEEGYRDAATEDKKIGKTPRVSLILLIVLAAFLLAVDQAGSKNLTTLQQRNSTLQSRVSQGFQQRIQVVPLHMAQCKDLSYTGLDGAEKFCATRGGILKINP
jgi:hypothetical protein